MQIVVIHHKDTAIANDWLSANGRADRIIECAQIGMTFLSFVDESIGKQFADAFGCVTPVIKSGFFQTTAREQKGEK